MPLVNENFMNGRHYIGYKLYTHNDGAVVIYMRVYRLNTASYDLVGVYRLKPTRHFRSEAEARAYAERYFMHMLGQYEWGYLGEVKKEHEITFSRIAPRSYVPTLKRRGYWRTPRKKDIQ